MGVFFKSISVLVVLALAVGVGIFLQLRDTADVSALVGKKTMQIVHYPTYGGSEVLRMIEVPLPKIKPWEVLVEVHAASINPVDYKMMEGYFFIIDLVLTHHPGFDVAGKVVAVGKSVQHTKVGDLVHGMTWPHKTGSLAEYLAIDESAISIAPKYLSYSEAAALPLVALTSYNSLKTLGGLKEGSRVLVLGGSSATGMIALQLAKAFGAAHVATTCSSRNDELVKSLGADETVNYRDHDVFDVMRKAGKQFDIIYDTVGAGKSVWDGAASGALASGGQLVTITGDVQRPLDIVDLLARGYQIVTRKAYAFLKLGGGGYHQYTQPGGDREQLQILGKLVEEGKLKAIVDKTYGFDTAQVQQAFKYLMAGHASGKVVINIRV